MDSILTTDDGLERFPAAARAPRIGFVGAGWIGAARMQALLRSGVAHAAAVCDPDPERCASAVRLAPDARECESFEAMLAEDLDGIVIATPSGQHAAQAQAALEAGRAVFCQKPLGRNAAETREVVAAARRANRLLEVDFCYRQLRGIAKARRMIRAGKLGRVFAADLVFHNAYGPDKPWFYDRNESGGGCLMDLGIHLIDLALWIFDGAAWSHVDGRAFAGGARLANGSSAIEDFVQARVDLDGGVSLTLACSWRLHAGRDAVIGAEFYGTEGSIAIRNIQGSFYDFTVEHRLGTTTREIDHSPDDWGGRPITRWAKRLRRRRDYDPSIETVVRVAELMDEIYAVS